MPMVVIQRVLTELWEMGYRQVVGFNNYNEPLMDKRLPDIARFARGLGFQKVRTITNGDLLTPALIRKLDGVVTHITVSCYDNINSLKKICGLFQTTRISIASGQHRLSHFIPSGNLQKAIRIQRSQPCHWASRNFIVNHEGDCLLCCEEIVPHFDLGNVYRQRLSDIWHGRHRMNIIRDISRPGGRLKYEHCKTCPRGENLSRKLAVQPSKHAIPVQIGD